MFFDRGSQLAPKINKKTLDFHILNDDGEVLVNNDWAVVMNANARHLLKIDDPSQKIPLAPDVQKVFMLANERILIVKKDKVEIASIVKEKNQYQLKIHHDCNMYFPGWPIVSANKKHIVFRESRMAMVMVDVLTGIKTALPRKLSQINKRHGWLLGSCYLATMRCINKTIYCHALDEKQEVKEISITPTKNEILDFSMSLSGKVFFTIDYDLFASVFISDGGFRCRQDFSPYKISYRKLVGDKLYYGPKSSKKLSELNSVDYSVSESPVQIFPGNLVTKGVAVKDVTNDFAVCAGSDEKSTSHIYKHNFETKQNLQTALQQSLESMPKDLCSIMTEYCTAELDNSHDPSLALVWAIRFKIYNRLKELSPKQAEHDFWIKFIDQASVYYDRKEPITPFVNQFLMQYASAAWMIADITAIMNQVRSLDSMLPKKIIESDSVSVPKEPLKLSSVTSHTIFDDSPRVKPQDNKGDAPADFVRSLLG